MAESLGSVKSGDIITADVMNTVLTKITELEERIEELEDEAGGGVVRIDGFDPPSDEGAPMGGTLTIYGSGFLFPPRENAVVLDSDEEIDDDAFETGASSNTAVTFMVPTSLSNISESGRVVSVKISNSQGEDTSSYRILPEVEGDPPEIDSVTGDGASTVVVDDTAVIVGSHFGEDPEVTFVFGGATVGTATIEVSDESEITITVPDMDEVPNDPGGVNMIIRVDSGVPPAATHGVTVTR